MRLAAAALATFLPFAAQADPVVVELFTSQGCSSCPAADAMLGRLAGREDVIALSLHVDYWDWIGWKDTFADPRFSERQRAYAAGWGSSMVFTPQFVVGGTDQVAGPSGMELADLIDLRRSRTPDLLRVASGAEGRKVMAMEAEQGGQIVLVTLMPEAQVEILHGENAGHSMTYHNVVAGWDVVADWSGDPASFVIPAPAAGMRQVVLAQAVEDGKPGAILGAVALD
jgi:hypothetical protein